MNSDSNSRVIQSFKRRSLSYVVAQQARSKCARAHSQARRVWASTRAPDGSVHPSIPRCRSALRLVHACRFDACSPGRRNSPPRRRPASGRSGRATSRRRPRRGPRPAPSLASAPARRACRRAPRGRLYGARSDAAHPSVSCPEPPPPPRPPAARPPPARPALKQLYIDAGQSDFGAAPCKACRRPSLYSFPAFLS